MSNKTKSNMQKQMQMQMQMQIQMQKQMQNTQMQNAQTQKQNEDKFHHATLAHQDDELQIIEEISLILPYIFIGSWDNSVDIELLRTRNIKCMLNVTEQNHRPESLLQMQKLGITNMHLSIENLPTAPLRNILAQSYTFIKNAVTNKKNVMIYCHQGLSTSVAILSYYILRNFYLTNKPTNNILKLVLEKVRAKRKYIDVNFGFIEQLEDIEAELSGRPVVDAQSLSIHRNKELKQALNRRMIETINDEKKYADTSYKITSKVRV